MRRWLIYGAVLLAMLLINGENRAGTDIGKLEPARVILVDAAPGAVSLYTDVGQYGSGRDLTGAVEDMKQTASGEVFLDTAEYLLLSPTSLGQLEELSRLLRLSCRVCVAAGVKDLEAAGEYLSIHKPDTTLGDWRKGARQLPVLYSEGERMRLAKPKSGEPSAGGLADCGIVGTHSAVCQRHGLADGGFIGDDYPVFELAGEQADGCLAQMAMYC